MTNEMDTTIYWDKYGYPTRKAAVELCGWCTKSGKATKTGEKIANTKWEDLSPAAKRVLISHGIHP